MQSQILGAVGDLNNIGRIEIVNSIFTVAGRISKNGIGSVIFNIVVAFARIDRHVSAAVFNGIFSRSAVDESIRQSVIDRGAFHQLAADDIELLIFHVIEHNQVGTDPDVSIIARRQRDPTRAVENLNGISAVITVDDVETANVGVLIDRRSYGTVYSIFTRAAVDGDVCKRTEAYEIIAGAAVDRNLRIAVDDRIVAVTAGDRYLTVGIIDGRRRVDLIENGIVAGARIDRYASRRVPDGIVVLREFEISIA